MSSSDVIRVEVDERIGYWGSNIEQVPAGLGQISTEDAILGLEILTKCQRVRGWGGGVARLGGPLCAPEGGATPPGHATVRRWPDPSARLQDTRGEDGDGRGVRARGLHSSTIQLNLSLVCHKKTPYTPLNTP